MKTVLFIFCLLPLVVISDAATCDGADMTDRYDLLHVYNDGYFVNINGCRDWKNYPVADEGECLQEGCASDADTVVYKPGVCYSLICGSKFAVKNDSNGFIIFRKKALSVRLAGGATPLTGAVEMYSPSHGDWGLVCDVNLNGMETWPIRVCSQLGFGHPEAVTYSVNPTSGSEVLKGKTAWQSSDYEFSTANKAIDGNNDADFEAGSCAHTQKQADPWWALDLGQTETVSSVSITNRGDCCGEELGDFVVAVTDKDPRQTAPNATTYTVCLTHSGSVDQGATVTLHCDSHVSGRYLVIHNPGQDRTLTLCEVVVMTGGKFVAFSEPQCVSHSDGDLLQECGQGAACSAAKAVQIKCAPPDNLVRLTGGITSQEGVVEYFNDQGEWGTVCDPSSNLGGWPHVVCSQLGYGPAIESSLVPHARTGLISMQDPGPCDPASINKLSKCPSGGSTCDHSTDVFLVCGVSIRLFGGDAPYRGYAQAFKNGVWGDICKNGGPQLRKWPHSFCQWLGYANAIDAQKRGKASTGPIHFKNPTCIGALHFLQCQNNGDCGHEQDTFVTCAPPPSQVRLTGGDTDNEGRADYNEGNGWGTICSSTGTGLGGWADVFCSQLGYGPALRAKYTNKDNQEEITLMQPACSTADARTMAECATGNGGCDHFEDVWIVCDPNAKPVKVVIMLDISGSLNQKETGSMLSQETDFLQKFFEHTTTKMFIYKYSLSLTVIPFKTAVIDGDKWVLKYADYKTTGDLADAENNGLNSFIKKVKATEPEGRTNIGQSMKNIADAHTADANTIVIVVSDFLNMDKTPDPVDLVKSLTTADAHVFPAMIDSPVKRQKLYGDFVNNSKDRWGMDLLAGEPDFEQMFARAMDEE